MYGVSVKSTFGDDEGPAQRLKALVGQYHRHSALGVDFIGKLRASHQPQTAIGAELLQGGAS